MKLAESGFSEEVRHDGEMHPRWRRSQYYAEWRGQIQRIYSAVEERARSKAAAAHLPRLVLIILTRVVAICTRDTVWSRWGTAGTTSFHAAGDPREISCNFFSKAKRASEPSCRELALPTEAISG